MSCPSSFQDGAFTCQIADRNHYDLHRDGHTTWADCQQDKEVKAA